MRELNLQGCRNVVNREGHPVPGLPRLVQLTSLSLNNCVGLVDGALLSLRTLTCLKSLDISGCQNITGAG